MAHLYRSQIGEPMPIGGRPILAMDAMPRARIGARAARDEDPDDNSEIKIASLPTDAAYKKLFQFLTDRLSPDDVQEASELVRQLFAETYDGTNGNGNSNAMAGDRRPPTRGYSQHYPNAHRLYKRTYG
jgi:hypothetical protein